MMMVMLGIPSWVVRIKLNSDEMFSNPEDVPGNRNGNVIADSK